MLPRSLRSLRALTPLARAEHTQPPLPLQSPPLPAACSPQQAPPCPPCPPQPRPPCRAVPPERVRALRVSCCPPPAGRRPPCAAPPPACTLTCANFTAPPSRPTPAARAAQMTAAMETEESATCGIERDHVAQRLAAAECIRRGSYLREAGERRAPRLAAVPREPYRLDSERECACATDGRVYAIAGPSGGGGTACAPDRTPPQPRCVELVPDNECQVATGDGIDPCAHQPRIFLEINRSNQKAITGYQNAAEDRARSFDMDSKMNSFEADKATCVAQSRRDKCAPGPPPVGFASRIMNSLSLGRGTTPLPTSSPGSGSESESGSAGGGGASCPRRACGAQCSTPAGAAKRAGDSGWCASPPALAASPPRCRPPSLAERLRRRAGPCSTSRRFHTAIPSRAKCGQDSGRDVKDIVAETKANAEKLANVLREREGLAEAGRGRVASGASGGVRPVGGNFDMPVPAGAARLRVRVELEEGTACAPPFAAPAHTCPVAASRALCTGVSKPSSWLSRLILRAKGASPCRPTGPEKTSSPSPCGQSNPSPSPCKSLGAAKPKPCGKRDGGGSGKCKLGKSDGKMKPCAKQQSGKLGQASGAEDGGHCAAPCRPPPCLGAPPRAPCDPPSTRCAAPLDALAHVIFAHT